MATILSEYVKDTKYVKVDLDKVSNDIWSQLNDFVKHWKINTKEDLTPEEFGEVERIVDGALKECCCVLFGIWNCEFEEFVNALDINCEISAKIWEAFRNTMLW